MLEVGSSWEGSWQQSGRDLGETLLCQSKQQGGGDRRHWAGLGMREWIRGGDSAIAGVLMEDHAITGKEDGKGKDSSLNISQVAAPYVGHSSLKPCLVHGP